MVRMEIGFSKNPKALELLEKMSVGTVKSIGELIRFAEERYLRSAGGGEWLPL